MPKPKTIYTCSACGNQETQWYGRCNKCWQWGTFKEKTTEKKKATGEKALFDEIWIERQHKSFLTGHNLDKYYGTDFYVNLFAHVLSKKKYPKFRLLKDNIVLLSPEEHMLFDQGTEEQRKKYQDKYVWVDWESLFSLRDQLIKKYNETYK